MILGITGHQDLEKYDENWIQLAITNFISISNVQKGLSSLAAGADQLFARKLNEKNINYDVIIPCAHYTSTFKTEKELKSYLSLLKLSKNILTLDFQQPNEKAFYAAGIELVNRSSTIMAIWDGKRAKGLGGTGDIVKKAIQQHKPVYHINPVTQECKYLNND